MIKWRFHPPFFYSSHLHHFPLFLYDFFFLFYFQACTKIIHIYIHIALYSSINHHFRKIYTGKKIFPILIISYRWDCGSDEKKKTIYSRWRNNDRISTLTKRYGAGWCCKVVDENICEKLIDCRGGKLFSDVFFLFFSVFVFWGWYWKC